MNLREGLPKIAEILANYGVVDISQCPDRVSVVNNWVYCRDGVIEAHKYDLLRFLEDDNDVISESVYPSEPPMNLKTRKWGNGEDGLFVLDMETFEGSLVGRFWLSHSSCDSNRWFFVHRAINEEYRGKGLGNAVSEVVDSLMQVLADSKGQEQIVVCDVKRVDILLWFLRNDYLPLDDDSSVLVDEILGDDGPDNFEISPSLGGGTFFIFRKGMVKGSCVTVKLQKKFEPN